VPRSDLLLICYPLVDCLLAPATCGTKANCLRSLVASLLPCSCLAVASRIIPPFTRHRHHRVHTAPLGWGRRQRSPSASWVVIPIGAAVTTNTVLPAAASAAAATSVRMRPSWRTLPPSVVTDPTAGRQRLTTVPRQRRQRRQQRKRSTSVNCKPKKCSR